MTRNATSLPQALATRASAAAAPPRPAGRTGRPWGRGRRWRRCAAWHCVSRRAAGSRRRAGRGGLQRTCPGGVKPWQGTCKCWACTRARPKWQCGAAHSRPHVCSLQGGLYSLRTVRPPDEDGERGAGQHGQEQEGAAAQCQPHNHHHFGHGGGAGPKYGVDQVVVGAGSLAGGRPAAADGGSGGSGGVAAKLDRRPSRLGSYAHGTCALAATLGWSFMLCKGNSSCSRDRARRPLKVAVQSTQGWQSPRNPTWRPPAAPPRCRCPADARSPPGRCCWHQQGVEAGGAGANPRPPCCTLECSGKECRSCMGFRSSARLGGQEAEDASDVALCGCPG